MGSFPVIMLPPIFDGTTGFLQADEPVPVQAIVAERAVEALTQSILDRLARRDEVQFDTGPLRPEKHGLAGELSSVIKNNSVRQALLPQPVQVRRKLLPGYGCIHHLAYAFPGTVIKDIQDAEPSACCQLIRDKIQRPALCPAGRQHHGAARYNRQFPAFFGAHLQTCGFVKAVGSLHVPCQPFPPEEGVQHPVAIPGIMRSQRLQACQKGFIRLPAALIAKDRS